MYIQINEKAPPAEQIRQLKTQLEIILDNLELESTVTPSTGDSLPEGGTDGQVLTKQTDGSAAWEDPAGGVAENGLPSGGTTDQMLVKNSNTDYDGKWVNQYTHPTNHSPAIISQDADNRFVTDAEISAWNAKQAALGFTPENLANKKTSLTDNSDDYYPTQKAVKSALDGKSNTGHGHAIADVTDLQTTLDGKAPAAKGVPTGGTTDQVLAKNSNTDNDMKWVTPGNSIPESSFTLPTLTTLSTQRAGSGTIETCNYGIRLKAPGTSGNTNSLIYAMQSLTEGAGGYRATARIRRFTPLEKWGMMGLILRNSSDGKSVMFGLGNDSIVGFNRNTFTNDTTWASVARAAIWYELDFWIRVVDNLTTRKIYVSKDGNRWQEIYSEAHDTHVAPNQVGVFLNPNFGDSTAANIRAEVSMEVYSWLFETL